MAPPRRPNSVLHDRSVNTAMSQNANGKRRAVEVLDLTGSDDEQPTISQSRKIQRTEGISIPPSQAQRIQWGEDDTEANADELLASTQDDGYSGADDMLELYGTLFTKIVGVQYYRGHATVGEHVIVRRQPDNQYDSNAIRVDNVQRDQIGHIPRRVAEKLARYIDAGDLLVDGTLIGRVGDYDCPVSICLFGTSDPAGQEELVNMMKADKLPLDAIKEKEKEAKKRRAAELKKVAKKGAGSTKGSSSQQWDYGSSQGQYTGSSSQGIDNPPQQSLEDIMIESERFNPREIGEVVEKFGAGEDALSQMPMAEAPVRLATSLLPYQRQGLAWLQEKENPQLPSVGSGDVVQLWKRSTTEARVYTNIATKFSVKDKTPILAKGGILADDMGLGKTLEVIALIVADLADCDSTQMSANNESMTTLIVAPLSVMSNWSGQIAQHVQKDKPLRVLTYYGTGRKVLKPSNFAEYDVVITTYGTLSTEYLPSGKKTPPEIPRSSGLYSMKWRRIVLDEGHNIRNPSTKGALAATRILATNRWVLTGTPIINSLKDLYSLVRFIGLTGGLERFEIFNSVLIRPLKAGREDATSLLQALMGTICLRRRKEMAFIDLRLPELTEYVHRIKFRPQEKEKYDALQTQAKGLLQTYQQRTTQGNGKKAQEAYRHLLEILLRLRQVCNHWKLCAERVTSLMSLLENQKVVDLTPENMKALQDMLQISIESREDCPICLEDLHNHGPVITHCAHVFGNDCIKRVIETQHKCPMCRAELKDEMCLVQPVAEFGDTADQDQDIDFDTSSSKIEVLLSILKASHRKEGTKLILFSQWTSFLDIVQKQLDEHGYHYTRIDGKMPAARRDEALRALESDPECTIMLASLGVCAVGLNLVAANQVVLMDSWWAPAIEDQAVDRVHRLGQKKKTTVWRLVMEGSIEERTLEIQAEKRKLMMTAFQEKSSKRTGGKTARLNDIEKLLA
ncbi:hypothetical protein MMC34_000565 [Xylographa carneopallida]|nr:hypothetical protein [Xylographa carneopallida]